jgi:uncharacterized cupin superfamily protein
MAHPVINLADLTYDNFGHGVSYPGAMKAGANFKARLGAVGAKIGAQKLGYNVTILPPGKRAFPFHSHRVNEEMFFVLEGAGEIRIGTAVHPIKQGDFIACPPGGPETAHHIINTSATTELKFLAVSTMQSPEIAEYPDSGKFGMIAHYPGAKDGKPEVVRFIGRMDMAVDYWEGE